MATFLFDKVVFGPVSSRRLGVSLGINLLPLEMKLCNFNCIYCECGLTQNLSQALRVLPSRVEVGSRLSAALEEMKLSGKTIDSITFAGNGEPTLHPEFAGIVEDTRMIRDRLMPKAILSVLTNTTRLQDPTIAQALKLVERPILKLDAGLNETFVSINHPMGTISLSKIVANIRAFSSAPIIQSMFIRCTVNGKQVDNTSEADLEAWLELLQQISPSLVMVYSTARDTALAQVERIDAVDLQRIAARVSQLGFAAEVY